jgi:hypothetical protein
MSEQQHCQRGGTCSPNDCQMTGLHGGINCAEVHRRKVIADAEQRERFRVSDLRVKIAGELGDSPPLFTGALGMPSERALLVRNNVQIEGLKEKKAEREAKAERMRKIIEAPGKTERTLSERVSDMVGRILEGGAAEPDAAAAQVALRFDVETRAVAAAAAALKELETELELDDLRIEHVEKRTEGYVDAVIASELERLGPAYNKAVVEYRKVAGPLFAGLKYIGEYRHRTIADLPRPSLDSCNSSIPDSAYEATITAEHERFFVEAAAALAVNPSYKLTFSI